MVRKAGHLFTTAYLLLIFGVYPFYMKEGYVDIGKAKYQFFICCSLAAAGILALTALAALPGRLIRGGGRRMSVLELAGRLSFTDLAVLLYASEVFCSFALSDYRQEAFQGTEGWYMGLLLLLTLCSLYFLISRLWRAGALVWVTAMAASALVFVLGILDRFSFHLIPLPIRQSNFISTLGNINWFCGYLSVLAPVGISLFVFQNEGPGGASERRAFLLLQRFLLLLYTLTAFLAGFCQGSDSILLFWGALFFILLWICVSKRLWLAELLFLFFLWCLSALGMRLLLLLFPEGYNYEARNLCIFLAQSGLVPIAGLLALLGSLFLKRDLPGFTAHPHAGKSLFDPGAGRRSVKAARGIMILFPALALLLWLGLSLYNTRRGIPSLAHNSLFLLDASWGNGRGATLKAGYRLWRSLSFSDHLLGVGPDCFALCAYSVPEIASDLAASFGSSRLTNAHNEFLTSLINIGLLGTAFYFGSFLSFMIRCLKKGGQSKYLPVAAVCVFCFLAHNMLSFAQVLNLPFAFLILAMGENLLRRKDSSPEKYPPDG